MRKADKVLFSIWAMFLPMYLALSYLFLILLEYGAIDVEMPFDGVIWLNSSCVLIIVYILGWFVNLTIDLIKDINRIIKKKKEKNNEKH